jgi:hypothetical protein
VNDPTYLTTDEAAELTRLSVRTLANRRSLGLAPRYYKAHGRVLYNVADLHAFVASGLVERAA